MKTIKRKSTLCFLFLMAGTLCISCSHSAKPSAETSQSVSQTETLAASISEDNPEVITDNPSEEESDSEYILSSPILQGINQKINSYMHQYRGASASYDQSSDSFTSDIKTETRPLMDMSAEGGTITRYEGKDSRLYRYRLNFYGETGRSEDNYYFADGFTYYTELTEEYSVPITLTTSETDILQRILTEGIIIDGTGYLYDREHDTILQSKVLDSVYTLEELETLFTSAFEPSSTSIPPENQTSISSTPSAGLSNLYKEFLIDDAMYQLTSTAEHPKGDSGAIYAFGDCNGDGVPELHIKGGYIYNIYTEQGGKVVLLQSFDRYGVPLQPLKDGGMIGYKPYGTIYDHYFYRRLDHAGDYIESESRDFNVEFSGESDPDKDIYIIDGVQCSKVEWEKSIAPYMEMLKNSSLHLTWNRVFPQAEWPDLDKRDE